MLPTLSMHSDSNVEKNCKVKTGFDDISRVLDGEGTENAGSLAKPKVGSTENCGYSPKQAGRRGDGDGEKEHGDGLSTVMKPVNSLIYKDLVSYMASLGLSNL